MFVYSKSVNGVILKPTKCPRNEACRCIEKKCEQCGWNPEVSKSACSISSKGWDTRYE